MPLRRYEPTCIEAARTLTKTRSHHVLLRGEVKRHEAFTLFHFQLRVDLRMAPVVTGLAGRIDKAAHRRLCLQLCTC